MESLAFEPSSPLPMQILEAARRGMVLNCAAPDGVRQRLDAETLRRACLSENIDPFGIRIANAIVDGSLDLTGARIDVPLAFAGCCFTHPVRLQVAELAELLFSDGDRDVKDCTLPGLLGNGLRLRGNLILAGMTVTGGYRTHASESRDAAVWLVDARIEGRVVFVGTHIATTAHRAVQADGMQVNGAVRFIRGFTTTAEIRLLRTRIGGAVDLTGADLAPQNGRALDVSEAVVGSIFILGDPVSGRPASIRGRIKLDHTQINGRLLLRAAHLAAPDSNDGREYYDVDWDTPAEPSIAGQGVALTGGISVERGVRILGGILLPEASIGGTVAVDGAELTSPADIALDLSRSQIKAAVSLRDTSVQGTVVLADAEVGGAVDLSWSRFSRPASRFCVNAEGLTVGGSLILRSTAADGGTMDFRSVTVAAGVDAEGARLENPYDATLALPQARIGGDLRLCHGFSSHGLVALNRVDVGGRLRCNDGEFRWTVSGTDGGDAPPNELGPNVLGAAFEANSANIRSGLILGWSVPSGAVDLTDTHTTYLADDPATDWPDHSHLSGFTYQRFRSRTPDTDAWSPAARIMWLTRVSPADPRPWEQAALVLRENGDVSGAERLLIARGDVTRGQRLASSRVRRWLDWAWYISVGYGYRPQRALVGLLTLVAAVSVALLPPAVHEHLRTSDAVGAVYSPQRYISGPDQTSVNRQPCGAGRVRCFSPIAFAVDTVVPIIDLKQRATWYPANDTVGQWMNLWLHLATVAGWLLSTVFALSLTRLGRPS